MQGKRSSKENQDILSPEMCKSMLFERQERRDLDFKRELDLSSTRDKTELAKDIAAMANTIGGHIIIGVDDLSFRLVGCSTDLLDIITPEDILNKINPFLAPELEDIRFRRLEWDGQEFGIIYVPESSPIVHVFAKGGNYTLADTGKQKCAFAKGSIYVRHGPKSEIITYKDLDRMFRKYALVDRRRLQEGLRRVVAAPAGSEVIIKGTGRMELGSGPSAVQVRLTDDPSAPAVKGLLDPSQPKSLDELITAHVKVWKSSRDNIMSKSTLLRAYESRNHLPLDAERLELLIYSSLMHNMPPVFWCSVAARELAERVVQRSFDEGRYPADKDAVRVAFLLGGNFGRQILAAAGRSSRLDCRNFADRFGRLIGDSERHIALAKSCAGRFSILTINADDVGTLANLLNSALLKLADDHDQSAKGTIRKLDILLYGGFMVRQSTPTALPPIG